ncbi:MAG: hypothetical protein M3R24_32500 [Chloroflexota bacterium]|nr:hypothetical protein [Chloroflexota bacterium]
MKTTHDPPLAVAINGLMAGMLGALAVTVMVRLGWAVMGGRPHADTTDGPAGISAAEALSEAPDVPPAMNQVTATFVQKVATGLFGTSLTPEQQAQAGLAWHLAYGGFWGMLYALVQASSSVPQSVLGPAWGVVVWAIGPGWLVPKMKLMLAPTQQQPRLTTMVIGVHAAYGAVVALVVHLLGRDDEARGGAWR